MKRETVVAAVLAVFGVSAFGADAPVVRSLDFKNQSAVVADPATKRETRLARLESAGVWTLMAVVQDGSRELAVFENHQDRKGDIVYGGTQGVAATLAKSLEYTSAAPGTVYGGKTLDEIAKSRTDVLGNAILAGKGDPTWEAVSAALPPLRVPTFVGTRYSVDKPTYAYGALSDEIYVDVGKVYTEIQKARDKHDVWEGLIGGWLPVLRFLFPAGPDRAWEVAIFADEDPKKFFTQPVWYRAILVENAKVKEAHYIDHHLPFPPRGEPDAALFYKALLKVHTDWHRDFKPGMTIDVPDAKISDFSLHSLVREMITRVGDHPKYGYPPLGGINVFGGYGYSNVDTFQDTFNSSVTAFLEWGAFDIAGRYIDNYYTNFVRDDGSIDTRGPEIGQYGRMLTVFAKHYAYTRDEALMRKHLGKLRAIAVLLNGLYEESTKLPKTDITYGIIRGWSEHDSALKVDPYRFMLPHFSNNAEASRGFHDLGEVWVELGRKSSDAKLEAEGRKLIEQAAAIKKDLFAVIERCTDRTKNPPYIPAVAGDAPTWGKGRVYTELYHSGVLSEELVKALRAYANANGGTMLALSRGGTRLNGFLATGPAYGLIQYDSVREYLMYYWAHMAHIYSRGTWTAVEGARIDGLLSGPYATPAQLTIPILTKWMLAFEEPDDPTLWLARATPRAWLEQGKKIEVRGAPTRFGQVSFTIESAIAQGKVSAQVRLPEGYNATTKLRFRVPDQKPIKSVTVNGRTWTDFSATQECVTLPPTIRGQVAVQVSY